MSSRAVILVTVAVGVVTFLLALLRNDWSLLLPQGQPPLWTPPVLMSLPEWLALPGLLWRALGAQVLWGMCPCFLVTVSSGQLWSKDFHDTEMLDSGTAASVEEGQAFGK